MKELLMERLKVVQKELMSIEKGSEEHKALVNELGILAREIANCEKNEMEHERLDLDKDKQDLERDKFIQAQGEKIVEVQDAAERKKWDRGLAIAKLGLGAVKIGVAILALRYEIFNHISGKADWEAIVNVFRGE